MCSMATPSELPQSTCSSKMIDLAVLDEQLILKAARNGGMSGACV